MNSTDNVSFADSSTVLGALSELLARLSVALRRADASMQRKRRVASDRGELARLSDRDLRDIGIDPARIRPAYERDWTAELPLR